MPSGAKAMARGAFIGGVTTAGLDDRIGRQRDDLALVRIDLSDRLAPAGATPYFQICCATSFLMYMRISSAGCQVARVRSVCPVAAAYAV